MRLRVLWMALACAMPLAVSAQQGDGTRERVQISVVKPDKVEATDARIARLKVPGGFAVAPFATDLKNVRVIVVAPDGTIYASRRDQGDVIMLRDANGDGRADAPPQVVLARAGAHGLAIHDNKLYLATVKEVFVADIRSDGTLGEARMIIGDLPDGGQHPNRTLAFGPDGMLYISVGSTCNTCNETHQESATMLRGSADGKSRGIFASGLRNTIGFDWHPQTGELWGMDHGIDFLGDNQQPEELNLLQHGKLYGWPHVYGRGDIHPQTTPPGELSKQQWKQMSVPMTLGYTAHAAPMQMLFYRGGQFPAEYRGDAFVTMRGSWNRDKPSGYEVVRIRYRDGKPQAIEPFLTGFLTDGGRTHFARPVGLAIMPDGALLVGDDANGVIYRVSATRPSNDAERLGPPPATEMTTQTSKGIGVPLAAARPETQARGTIGLQSASFAANAPIPLRHSEYADGVSPRLQWQAVEGAQSYALIMEDPDAKPITPFVHWVIWNIPPNVHTLPEGLQEQHRLTEPEGALQGRASNGRVGYYGPRPPVSDPPHHYHFQILALDRMLDLPPGATRDEVLAAAKGHVLAKGTLVGTFRQTQQPLK